jgi:lipoic acid synthetase
MGSDSMRLPDWFRVSLPAGPVAAAVRKRLRQLDLHTVCEEARCPNQGECWAQGTATILILGDVCTRGCRFCAVTTGHPTGMPDPGEPARVAASVRDAELNYVVLTSVDRDDLPDGGASVFADTIRAIRQAVPGVLVEALIPDYLGHTLEIVIDAGPHVLGHNIEVVRRLTPSVRDRRASYDRSLDVLRLARKASATLLTKSSLMVGLGETDDEVLESLRDLRAADVSIVTLGQYLQPTKNHHPVNRYVTPEQFQAFEVQARDMGFEFAASGPRVRSSYRAAELFVHRRLS